MDRKKLKELAKDPRFISGIFNYCDRWCERCPMTQHCLLYTQEEAAGNIGKEHDLNSEEFMNQMMDIFAQTREMILEVAQEQGIDLSKVDQDEDVEREVRKRKEKRDRSKEKDIAKDGMKYIKLAQAFFKKNDKLFKSKGKELVSALKMDLPGKDPEKEALDLSDAVDIVQWYQHQIYVKIGRALSGIDDSDDLNAKGETYPRDSDGSAKVALIGIDRSIEAWGRLRDHFPKRGDRILDILAHLQRLRRKTEAVFPHARAFKRPGFDD